MSMGREALRRAAKKIYKEQTKKIPKKQRMPFAQFFKQYKDMQNQKQAPDVDTPDSENEDFNFEDLVNINEIDDDSVEVIEGEEDTPEEDSSDE